jgi:hypothetical protein
MEHKPRAPVRVRLPGFTASQDVGLGSAIKRATSSFGIQPCGRCLERAHKLDRLMVFRAGRVTPRSSR